MTYLQILQTNIMLHCRKKPVTVPEPVLNGSHAHTQAKVYDMIVSAREGITNREITDALQDRYSRIGHISDQLYQDGLVHREKVNGGVLVYYGRAN